MTAPIGPGDWVICVRTRNASTATPWLARFIRGAQIREGVMYQVQEARDRKSNSDGTSVPGSFLVLEQAETHWTAWNALPGAWNLEYFRPAGRGGMFNSLLTAKPVRVGEDA